MNASKLPAVGVANVFAALDGAVSLANLGRGTQLFSVGDTSDRVFVLRSGRIKLWCAGPGGKHCIFHIVEPGEVFGEAAVLGEQTRSATAEVLEPAAVVMIPARAARSALDRHPEIWSDLAPLLQKRLENLEEQVQWVSFLEVEQRIARMMLRWAERNAGRSGETGDFRLSQKDLAGLVGATRETTSSALNRLQRDGCIEIRRRSITIASLENLRRRVGESGIAQHGASAAPDAKEDREAEFPAVRQARAATR